MPGAGAGADPTDRLEVTVIIPRCYRKRKNKIGDCMPLLI